MNTNYKTDFNYEIFSNALLKDVGDIMATGKKKHSTHNKNKIPVYGKFLITENINDQSYYFQVSISLVTPFMAKADAHFYRSISPNINLNFSALEPPTEAEEQIFQHYHPYFFQFTSESMEGVLRDFIREHAGEWVVLYFANKKSDRYDSYTEIAMDGTVVFSASPLIRKGNMLIINPESCYDPICKDLDSMYSIKNVEKLTSSCVNNLTTLEMFKNLLPKKIRHIMGTVYNVDHGNNIKLHIKDNLSNICTILYDVGYDYRKSSLNKKDIKNNLESFQHSKFDAVVLSHWDTDHIIGVAYYNPDILYSKETIWVAPVVVKLFCNTFG